MMTIITGLPGNGKTLYALALIKAYAEKENRDVYYSGIKDLLLPWTEVKPEEWFTLPAGAIIVIDECQFVFPKKPNGSKLPEFYEKLAVHRHSGYDIFLITQHPSLVDNFVRQLCGRHFHVIRKFGMQRANVWEWPAANTSPEKAASHKNAVLHKFKYPKNIYDLYKSAEVHTHKRSIPAKLILAVLFVIAVFALGYYVLDRFQKKAGVKPSDAPENAASASSGGSGTGKAYLDPMADARNYVFQNAPRITGLAHTAPKYDDVTRPTRAPIPAACVQSSRSCECYSQQGTRLQTTLEQCVQLVRNGFFQDFDPDGQNNSDDQLASRNNVQTQLK